MAALAALLCGTVASPAFALPPEEGWPLGCGCQESQIEENLPFTRALAATGKVSGSLEDSVAQAGIPAAVATEALAALGAGVDLGRVVRDGDRFYVRYEQTFSLKGNPIGVPRLLWAELRSAAKGTVSIHRFRAGKDGTTALWLADGQNTAAPEIRLPLENVLVSSGFGMRADPFDQPARGGPRPATPAARPAGGPQPQPSPLTNPATLNVSPELGIKLGLAPAGLAATKYSGFRGTMAMHEGVDLAAPMGTPVRAAGDGVIKGAEMKGGYGNWVEIEHEAGSADAKVPKLATVYGHLSAFAAGIAPGVRVKQGDVIGFVGSTGRSTGPHLHFEILQNGRPTNPMVNQALRREQLRGGELLRFKKQVARDLKDREREAGAI